MKLEQSNPAAFARLKACLARRSSVTIRQAEDEICHWSLDNSVMVEALHAAGWIPAGDNGAELTSSTRWHRADGHSLLPRQSQRCAKCGRARSLHPRVPFGATTCTEEMFELGISTSDANPPYPFRGEDFHRIDRERTPSNSLEQIFAETWFEKNQTTPTLETILGHEPTEAEHVAVASFVQWLGTHGGQAFLWEIDRKRWGETAAVGQRERKQLQTA